MTLKQRFGFIRLVVCMFVWSLSGGHLAMAYDEKEGGNDAITPAQSAELTNLSKPYVPGVIGKEFALGNLRLFRSWIDQFDVTLVYDGQARVNPQRLLDKDERRQLQTAIDEMITHIGEVPWTSVFENRHPWNPQRAEPIEHPFRTRTYRAGGRRKKIRRAIN